MFVGKRILQQVFPLMILVFLAKFLNERNVYCPIDKDRTDKLIGTVFLLFKGIIQLYQFRNGRCQFLYRTQ